MAYHLRKTPSRDDVAGVYEAVEVPGRLLDLFAHLVFAVEVEDICDEIKCVLIILHFSVEAGEIETVGQIFFVDLAKVFVATGGDEL